MEPVISSPTIVLTKKLGVKCCCGKVCKGARGLKMHQRSCRVILGLNEELLEHVIEQEQVSNETSGSPSPLDQISMICFKRCPYLRTY